MGTFWIQKSLYDLYQMLATNPELRYFLLTLLFPQPVFSSISLLLSSLAIACDSYLAIERQDAI
jgi:hypothetical protein